jgi:hypothetical protein
MFDADIYFWNSAVLIPKVKVKKTIGEVVLSLDSILIPLLFHLIINLSSPQLWKKKFSQFYFCNS